MISLEVKIDVVIENNRFVWRLPQECSDLTLNWRDLWSLGDMIGENAFLMVPTPSDPGQDEAIADQVRVGRHSTENAVIYFNKKMIQFNWNRGTALIVAEKFCKMAETIAEELVQSRKINNKK